MKKRCLCIIISIIFVFSLALTACTDQEQPTQEGEQQQTKEQSEEQKEPTAPVQGGKLILQAYKVDTLNPLFTKSASNAQALNLIFDNLVKFDGHLNVVPSLAEKWDVSEDGLTWTFHLKQGVHWHDGTEFTADDVDFTFKVLMNKNTVSAYKANVHYVAYFGVEDKYTFKVVLSEPYGSFVRVMNIPIIPKHQFEGMGLDEMQQNFHPIGTGPYQFVSYSPMKQVELAANERWWKGKRPYIDQIIVKIVPDNSTALYALQAKEVDYISTNVVNWEKYSGKDNITTKEYLTNYYEFLGVNFSHPVLKDKTVRQAMAYGLNREQIIQEVLLGHARTSDVPIRPDSALYDASSRIYRYDVNKAKEILLQGGWQDGNNDGILEKEIDGVVLPLAFEIVTNDNNTVRGTVAEMMVKQLKEIGMQVTLRKIPWEELNKAIESKDFDAILSGYFLSPAGDLTFAFHSKEIKRGTNFTSYINPEMDELLYKAFRETGTDQKKKAYSQLQKYVAEELPYISLYFRTSAVVYNDKIQGGINPIDTNIYNDIEKWYIQQK